MKKIKNNINLITLILNIVLCVPNIIITKLDYVYRPKSYILFILVYVIFTGLLTFFSIKNRNIASKLSRKAGSFLIFFSLLYPITLPIDLAIDNRLPNVLYFMILITVSISSSLLIFFMYNKIKWLKISVMALTGISVPYYMLLLFGSLLLSNFKEQTIIQTFQSPDNTHTAYVMSANFGATGGATEVYVRNTERDIYLVSGILKTESEKIWAGSWDSDPIIYWQDNDTILINGENYDIK